MLGGFTALLLCQLLGESLARGLGLPVPGPVIGLVLLAAALLWLHRKGQPEERFEALGVTRVANGLLGSLSLLFVPAGVGVVDQAGLLRAQALPLGAAVVGSTLLTLAVTVLVFTAVKRRLGRGGEGRA